MDRSPVIEFTLDRSGDPPYDVGVVCKPGDTVTFIVKSFYRIALKKLVIFTNYPKPGKSFERSAFTPLESVDYDGKKDWSTSLTLAIPGSFAYYLKWTDDIDIHKCKTGSIMVVAPLVIQGKDVAHSAFCSQTFLAHSLGPISNWHQHFAKSSQLKYNMIHFTSINELGASKSAYCIRDQLAFNPRLLAGLSKDAIDTPEKRLEIVKEVIDNLDEQYGIAGIVDMVWNHTSIDSPWILDHPECCFNLENSPYLKPAFLLDEALQQLSKDIADGVYVSKGLGKTVNDERSLSIVCQIIENQIIPRLKLWEFFVIDVDHALQEFEEAVSNTERHELSAMFIGNEVETLKKEAIHQDPGLGRHSIKVDVAWAVKLFAPSVLSRIDHSKVSEKIADYKIALNKINLPYYEKLNEHIRAAVTNLAHQIRYDRISADGPRKTDLSASSPLVSPYFTKIVASNGRTTYAANNGWIWGGNPTKNFADRPAYPYLRREILIWTDLLKLNYGSQPADCPFLWNHMKAYTEQNAKIFRGFRVDNCHSTPAGLASYMLDAARAVRPDIYITAELFSGSEHIDNVFVSKLGLNSLIRESMQCADPAELVRMLRHYGGKPVGSFKALFPPSFHTSHVFDQETFESSLHKAVETGNTLPAWSLPVRQTKPPAFFFDCTHDNQTPWMKRTGEDYLSNMALVWMSKCAVGTTAGYDWIVSNNPHVIDQRLYPTFREDEIIGIMKARKFFNELHQRLDHEVYSEVNIWHHGNLVIVQRHNPHFNTSIVCIAQTAFYFGNTDSKPTRVQLPGVVTKRLFCAKLAFYKNERPAFKERHPSKPHHSYFSPENSLVLEEDEVVKPASPIAQETFWTKFDKSKYIVGEEAELLCYESDEDCQGIYRIEGSMEIGNSEHTNVVNWINFPPGSVLVLETSLPRNSDRALEKLRENLKLPVPTNELTYTDMNYILFRCEQEERLATNGKIGTYFIQDYGNTAYVGIQGVVSILDKIRANRDYGHPLLTNLKKGNWYMDYVVARLSNPSLPNSFPKEGIQSIGKWFESQFALVQALPRHLVPKYFDLVVMKAYLSIVHNVPKRIRRTELGLLSKNGCFVNSTDDTLVRSLVMCGVQLCGALPSNALIDPRISLSDQFHMSIAAGFPHFAAGYMRSWGRDTFISIRGMLLLPGRFAEARNILIGCAGTLRHGLLPNLIDGCWNPRYNSRDAVWWFLEALQQYCKMSSEGHAFLKEKIVPRFFPTDDHHIQPGDPIEYVTMGSIVQEIMERHANGIHFRERNAGEQIDRIMKDEGFNIDVNLDHETGFIFGGNKSNCGTWMDKMGGSAQAGNRGVPATPRDGSAIELIGLLKSATRWLTALSGSQPTPVAKRSVPLASSGSIKRSASPSAGVEAILPLSPVISSSPMLASPYLSAEGPISDHITAPFISPSPSPVPASPSPSIISFGGAIDTDSSEVDPNSKFSAPPILVPEPQAPLNLPPPLFASKSKPQITATSNVDLGDYLNKKHANSISVHSLHHSLNLEEGLNPFPWTGVTIRKPDGTEFALSYADWDNKLKANFEKCFYVPHDAREDTQYKLHRSSIARRNIYKDTYKSSSKFTDYQLRPNMCITMVVAPELFVPSHAAAALEQVEKHLLGPLGMRTLDPTDSHYRSFYDNNNNSDDYYAANGFSYHMGPEWLWPLGFFIRAKLQFSSKPPLVALNQVQRIVQPHREAILATDWRGLPELTNSNGAFCPGSCSNQAWSAACLLEALYDIHNY